MKFTVAEAIGRFKGWKMVVVVDSKDRERRRSGDGGGKGNNRKP